MPTSPGTSKLWDYEAYAAIPDDLLRHEIIGGAHFANPAPNLYHQTVSRRLQFQLYEQIELNGLGVVFNAPVDLQLTDHDIVQPDIVVIARSRKHIMTPTKIRGVPSLVIEVLSPSNPKHDKVLKRGVYQSSCVPEYWIVDPSEHSVLQLILGEDEKYSEQSHTESVSVQSELGATVDLTKVWGAD